MPRLTSVNAACSWQPPPPADALAAGLQRTRLDRMLVEDLLDHGEGRPIKPGRDIGQVAMPSFRARIIVGDGERHDLVRFKADGHDDPRSDISAAPAFASTVELLTDTESASVILLSTT